MIIINQILFTVRQVNENRRAVATKLLTYIILIFILGSAFSNLFEPVTINKFQVIYCVDDLGDSGQSFIDNMISQKSITEYIDFKKISSYDEAQILLENGDAEAFIYLKDSFSNDLETVDSESSIDVYLRDSTGVNATVVKTVMESFINSMNSAMVVYKIQGNLEGFSFGETESILERGLSAEGKVPSAMSYYTIGMLLMMIFYGSQYGCEGVGEDYLGVLGERKKLAPVSKWKLYTGKMVGLTLVSVIQAVIVMLFAGIVYHVEWGTDYPMLLFIVLTFSALTTTLGALLCILTKDIQKGEIICIVLIILCTFLAGGFVAADFGGLERISPSYYAKTALFNVVYGGSNQLMLQCIAVMWVTTAVMGVITVILAGRKRA